MGLANSPGVETDKILCPADVSDLPKPIPADPDGPDAETEVEPTDKCIDPYPALPEISTGNRSLVPLPCRMIHPNPQATSATSYPGTEWIICLAVPDHRHSCHAQ